jgi:hypothetical protein
MTISRPIKPLFKFYTLNNKAISCFFSVLRLFKIVEPTRQPGKKQTSLKKKKKPNKLTTLSLHVVQYGHETTKIRHTSFINKGNRSTQEGV